MGERPKPFDPKNDCDAIAEIFRKHMAHMFLMAEKSDPRFAGLDSARQLECFVSGVMTGMLGVAFSCVRPESRDDMVRMLVDYLPQARLNVEAMMREGLH